MDPALEPSEPSFTGSIQPDDGPTAFRESSGARKSLLIFDPSQASAPASSARYFCILTFTPLTWEQLTTLRKSKVDLSQGLNDNYYLFHNNADADVDFSAIEKHDWVDKVTEYHWQWKISEGLFKLMQDEPSARPEVSILLMTGCFLSDISPPDQTIINSLRDNNELERLSSQREQRTSSLNLGKLSRDDIVKVSKIDGLRSVYVYTYARITSIEGPGEEQDKKQDEVYSNLYRPALVKNREQKGKGVVIGIFDTGVDKQHEIFASSNL